MSRGTGNPQPTKRQKTQETPAAVSHAVISQEHPPEKVFSLIYVDSQTKRYLVSKEAKQLLSRLHGPLGVFAAAGPYRTGKSWLLDKLIGFKAFGVGHTTSACTQGINFSNVLFPCETSDGKMFYALPLDTEGLMSVNADATHDTRIFALTLLLCTLFMYNGRNSIDKNSLSTLSLVIHLSKTIRDSNPSAPATDPHFFPYFLFVLRDFALQFPENVHTPSEYLEHALLTSAEQERKAAGDNTETGGTNVSDWIRQNFPKRSCFTMVRPTADESDLQKLDRLKDSELRPEFTTQLQDLRQVLRHSIWPKQAFGKYIGGEAFVQMAELFCDAINSGKSPVVQDAWTTMSDTHHRTVVEECIAHFQHKCQQFLKQTLAKTELDWVLPDSFKKLVLQWKEQAYHEFQSRCFRDVGPEALSGYQKKLAQELDRCAKEKTQENEDTLRRFLHEVMLPRLNEKARQAPSFQEFTQLMSMACKEIEGRLARCFDKTEIGDGFARSYWANLMWSNTATWTNLFTQQVEESRKALEAKFEEFKTSAKQELANGIDQIRKQWQEEKDQWNAKWATLATQHEALDQAHQQLKQEHQQQKAQWQQECDSWKRQVEQNETLLATHQKDMQTLQQDLERETHVRNEAQDTCQRLVRIETEHRQLQQEQAEKEQQFQNDLHLLQEQALAQIEDVRTQAQHKQNEWLRQLEQLEQQKEDEALKAKQEVEHYQSSLHDLQLKTVEQEQHLSHVRQETKTLQATLQAELKQVQGTLETERKEFEVQQKAARTELQQLIRDHQSMETGFKEKLAQQGAEAQTRIKSAEALSMQADLRAADTARRLQEQEKLTKQLESDASSLRTQHGYNRTKLEYEEKRTKQLEEQLEEQRQRCRQLEKSIKDMEHSHHMQLVRSNFQSSLVASSSTAGGNPKFHTVGSATVTAAASHPAGSLLFRPALAPSKS